MWVDGGVGRELHPSSPLCLFTMASTPCLLSTVAIVVVARTPILTMTTGCVLLYDDAMPIALVAPTRIRLVVAT